jgi:GNAT superfamily N-acetyltransferase
MRDDERALAIDWAADEGWNPGLHDAGALGTVDPNGWLIAEIDGEPVGCITALRYDESFAFVGFYIVKAQHRGKGYGLALWEAAMEHVSGFNVGLDGVLDQVDNYAKSGFVLDVRNARYRGISGGVAGSGTAIVTTTDLPEIIAYDRTCFPAPREAFLRSWSTLPDSFSRIARDGGEVVGYGTIRRCREGWKIGPLFANDAATAKRLFDDLRSHADGESVYLDVPTSNAPAVELANRAGMEIVFETARMYTRGRPTFASGRVFGVTSFELG